MSASHHLSLFHLYAAVTGLGEAKVRGSLKGISVFSHLDRDFIPPHCTGSSKLLEKH